MLKFLNKKITREKLDKFVKSHSDDAYTLDLGCANSPYSKYFKNRLGFDIQKGKNVDVVGDAHKLPFEDAKFDQILCTEVLEHLHSPDIAVSEMKRVLKPNGKLILSTRFIFPIHDAPNDYFRYTEFGLRSLFKDWKIESLEAEAGDFETYAILLQRFGFYYQTKGRKFLALLFLLKAKLLAFIFSKFKKGVPIITSGYYLVCRK